VSNTKKDKTIGKIISFIERLKSLETIQASNETTISKLKNKCTYEVKNTREQRTSYGEKRTDAGVKKVISRYRKHVKEYYARELKKRNVPTVRRKRLHLLKNNILLHGFLHTGKIKTNSINNKYIAKVKDRMSDDYTIEVTATQKANAINEAIGLLTNKRGYIKNMIGLCLLTGRRPIEVLKTGVFELVNNNTILFSGQAKGRIKEVSQVKFEIPVLHDAKTTIDAIKELRVKAKNLQDLTNIEIDKRTSEQSSKQVKKIFPEISELINDKLGCKIKVKDLRKLYVAINWYNLPQRQKRDYQGKALHWLGHGLGQRFTKGESTRKSSQMTYESFLIID